MISARALLGAAAVALLLVPPATAGAVPAYLFLRDAQFPAGTPGPVHGLPVGDGELTPLPPDPLDLVNLANNSAPQSRLVVPAQDMVHPNQFVLLNRTSDTGFIFGPIIVLLYVPETPAVQSGNLTVQLVALPKDYGAASILPVGDVIAETTIDLAYQNTTGPDPNTLVPPDPTDPQGAVAYITGQLLFYGLTELAKARYIGYLDDAVKDRIVMATVDPGTPLALRFSLVPSPQPAPVPLGLPVAQGAGQPILYDFAVTPALVYVPFYSQDPTVTTPPPMQGPHTTTHAPPPDCCHPEPTSSTSSSSPTQKSPGIPVAIALAAIGGVAFSVRRRLR